MAMLNERYALRLDSSGRTDTSMNKAMLSLKMAMRMVVRDSVGRSMMLAGFWGNVG